MFPRGNERRLIWLGFGLVARGLWDELALGVEPSRRGDPGDTDQKKCANHEGHRL